MWLTLPRPFAGCFHGSSRAWNSALVVRLVCRSWNGALGGCVPLTGSQLSSLAFFGCGGSLESMCLTVMSTEGAFLETAPANITYAEGLNAKKGGERERERGCLFLILLGLVNYIVKALLLLQVNKGALQCWGLTVSLCPLLVSAAPSTTSTQTQILTHDITLECCCDVFKVKFKRRVGLSLQCTVQ